MGAHSEGAHSEGAHSEGAPPYPSIVSARTLHAQDKVEEL